MIKVKQLRSATSGRDIPNQFVITEYETGNKKWVRQIFQSYDSIIAWKDDDGFTVLDKNYWDYSRTTGKYRNQFLGEDIKTTRKKIKSGEYRLADLNNTYN
tara:strand:- start:453 stop:755 length:303 start_codon:yes stop_codon:yes gene_type:complete